MPNVMVFEKKARYHTSAKTRRACYNKFLVAQYAFMIIMNTRSINDLLVLKKNNCFINYCGKMGIDSFAKMTDVTKQLVRKFAYIVVDNCFIFSEIFSCKSPSIFF